MLRMVPSPAIGDDPHPPSPQVLGSPVQHKPLVNNLQTLVDNEDIVIPISDARRGNEIVWKNKLVLIFQTKHSPRQAQDWITDFNRNADIKLVYHDELRNFMYVVEVITSAVPLAQERILERSPLKAKDSYASVNLYHRGFHHRNPIEAKHIVKATIRPGDQEIHFHLEHIVSKIGRLVDKHIASGAEDHKVTALIETTRRLQPETVSFLIEGVRRTIPLDFVSASLRCYHCFAYKHLPHRCPEYIAAKHQQMQATSRLAIPER